MNYVYPQEREIFETILNSSFVGEALSTSEIISIAGRIGGINGYAISGLNYTVDQLLQSEMHAEQASLVATVRQAIRLISTS